MKQLLTLVALLLACIPAFGAILQNAYTSNTTAQVDAHVLALDTNAPPLPANVVTNPWPNSLIVTGSLSVASSTYPDSLLFVNPTQGIFDAGDIGFDHNKTFININDLTAKTITVSATNGTQFYGPVTGSFSAIGGNVVTNGTSSQQWLTFSTFQVVPGNINSVWKYVGTATTNLVCPNTNAPIYTDSSFPAVRDGSQFRWVDNSGNVIYLMSYGAYFAAGVSNIVGVAQSFDGGKTYLRYGYIDFAGAHFNQWSAKFAVNATNGLELTVGLGENNTAGPTNNFICDISTANYTNFSNLRVLGQRGVSGTSTEQSSGILLYQNGLYNYFDSSSQQFTNSTLGPSGWALAYNDGSENSSFGGQGGPTVVRFNNIWYWFITDGNLNYVTSTDLNHWVGATGQPVFFTPYDSPTTVSGVNQEGTAIVQNYAVTPEIQSGIFNGAFSGNAIGATNQGYARSLTGTNILWTPTVQSDGNTNWSGVITNTPATTITGQLPALNASSLTSLNAANIVGLSTNGLVFVSVQYVVGTLYTNTLSNNIVVAGVQASPTTALSAGQTSLKFQNGASSYTVFNEVTVGLIGSASGGMTNGLASQTVGPGVTYGWTDTSAGAGNSCTLATTGAGYFYVSQLVANGSQNAVVTNGTTQIVSTALQLTNAANVISGNGGGLTGINTGYYQTNLIPGAMYTNISPHGEWISGMGTNLAIIACAQTSGLPTTNNVVAGLYPGTGFTTVSTAALAFIPATWIYCFTNVTAPGVSLPVHFDTHSTNWISWTP